jgi:hypothetical protein
MIYQISPVPTKTQPISALNKGLIQARRIQALVKKRAATASLPDRVQLWSPMTGPHMVPVTRWIE